MGRDAKPEIVKKLEGTARKDRQRTTAVGYSKLAAVPDPPATLDDYGADIWIMLCTELIDAKMLMVTDLFTLEILVGALVDYRDCCDKLKGKNKIIIGVDKQPKPNPYVKLKRQATETIGKYIGHFGFSPLARIKLSALTTGGDDKPDAFAEFLFGDATDV